MTPEERESIEQRRDAALQRLDEGHQILLKSLEGLEAEEAFLGQRWSVRDVLLHLDSERYVDALEKIARGEMDMLPPFSSRDEHFRQELEQQEATHRRFRALLTELAPEQLARPATPPNPENAFPGLTLLELLERTSGHEASHARQIDLTRQYVAAFRSQERALNIAALGDGNPAHLSQEVKDLLNMADYVVGEADALAAVAHMVRGVRHTIHPGNREEMVNRAARDTREGLWAIVCIMGNADDNDETVATARKFAETLAIHRPLESNFALVDPDLMEALPVVFQITAEALAQSVQRHVFEPLIEDVLYNGPTGQSLSERQRLLAWRLIQLALTTGYGDETSQ